MSASHYSRTPSAASALRSAGSVVGAVLASARFYFGYWFSHWRP